MATGRAKCATMSFAPCALITPTLTGPPKNHLSAVSTATDLTYSHSGHMKV
jgi:hypothetical protein